MARLANDRAVRSCLSKHHGIVISDDSVFIGGQHNTTADIIEYFDLDLIPLSHNLMFSEARRVMDEACAKNALERCKRFLLAEHVKTPTDALEHVVALGRCGRG